MSNIEIRKHCEINGECVDYKIEFIIPTISSNGDQIVLTVNAEDLKNTVWSDFIINKYHVVTLADEMTSTCDYASLMISKSNGEFSLCANSMNGFKFTFSVDFGEIVDELRKLDTWFRKVKFN